MRFELIDLFLYKRVYSRFSKKLTEITNFLQVILIYIYKDQSSSTCLL